MARLIWPGTQFIDSNGNPISGGLLYTYQTGTTTDKTTYSDKALTSANANPIVLDSSGWPSDGASTYVAVFGDANGTDYRLVLKDSTAATTYFTDDEVPNPEAPKQDIGFNWSGVPAANDEVNYSVVRAITLPVSLTGSQGYAITAATGSTAFDIQKNGSSVGTATIAGAGNTVSFTFASATSFAAGDRLSIQAPAVADATCANISITLVATVT